MTVPVDTMTNGQPQKTTVSLNGAMLVAHLNLLNVAMKQNDKRIINRVLHYIPQIRPSLNAGLLLPIINAIPFSPAHSPMKAQAAALIASLPTDMSSPLSQGDIEKVAGASGPIGELYICFMAALLILQTGNASIGAMALLEIIKQAESKDSRVLDPLLARLFYYYGRALEVSGSLSSPDAFAFLMIAFRKSALRRDDETHAVLHNVLVRLMVLQGQCEQALKFIQASPFPQDCSGPNVARHHYYLASIQAIQGEYAMAHENLEQAQRKAPHGKAAAGFVQSVTKLSVVVRLLLGEIPERSLFRQPMFASCLRPYLALCQSVRLGDMGRFQSVIQEMAPKFMADRSMILIQRLHQTVLKAGLRRLSVAYSRIPLADIQRKLGLATVDDAEFVVIKSLKEGLVQGHLDHAAQFLQCDPRSNTYYTTDPQRILHERLEQLASLQIECQRALRYPEGVKKSAAQSTTSADALPTEAELMDDYLEADDDF